MRNIPVFVTNILRFAVSKYKQKRHGNLPDNISHKHSGIRTRHEIKFTSNCNKLVTLTKRSK